MSDTKREGSTLVTKAKTFLKQAHELVKKERYISRALKHFGYKKAASIAHIAGYGRRRRTRRRRVV